MSTVFYLNLFCFVNFAKDKKISARKQLNNLCLKNTPLRNKALNRLNSVVLALYWTLSTKSLLMKCGLVHRTISGHN